MTRKLALALSVALLAGAAGAQTAEKREQPSPSPPKSPPTAMPLPPGQGEGSGSSMSDRLSKSQGVIRPPQEVDPTMKQETPPTGPNSMPVIPPPGTPGGDQSVKPK
jgi:hypothetical protein